MKKLIYIVALTLAACVGMAKAEDKPKAQKPDLDKIKTETTDEKSKYYYPKLLKMFMSNDTIMDATDFQYFYYGTMFQEDYDPYRTPYNQEELDRLEPLYYKTTHTRAEKDEMQKYAIAAIHDNPLDLVQLKNLIYVYEQNQKVNLAKIWKNKLNHLLQTIALSGTGHDAENAWMVAYPRHEFDFLNISGISVVSSEFQPPYYECVTVNKKTDKDPDTYYFNLKPVLDQYYLKHPSEVDE